MTASITLRKAEVKDALEMASVDIEAFYPTSVTYRKLFPLLPDTTYRDSSNLEVGRSCIEAELSAGHHDWVVVEKAGRIIAIGKWIFPANKSAAEAVAYDFPEHVSGQAISEFFDMLQRGRDAYYGPDSRHRYVVMQWICTRPGEEGQGAAKAILNWGLDRADALGIDAWIEASALGHPVYEKLGFRDVDQCVVEHEGEKETLVRMVYRPDSRPLRQGVVSSGDDATGKKDEEEAGPTILVTGASGFLGQELTKRLISSASGIHWKSLILTDIHDPVTPQTESKITFLKGHLTDIIPKLAKHDIDVAFVLHGIMSGESESNHALGMAVNFASTYELMKSLSIDATHPSSHKRRERPVKVIYTSTLAVYSNSKPSPPAPSSFSSSSSPSSPSSLATPANQGDATRGYSELDMTLPQSSYGTAKSMIEYLLNDYSRRGLLDARILRVPTVAIRPGRPSSAASSYVSGIIREPILDTPSSCPVDGTQASWICPPKSILRHLCHAMTLDGETLAKLTSRTINLPGLKISVDEQLRALEAVKPGASKLVTFEPDQAVRAIVESWVVNVDTSKAFALGFEPAISFEEGIQDFIDGLEKT